MVTVKGKKQCRLQDYREAELSLHIYFFALKEYSWTSALSPDILALISEQFVGILEPPSFAQNYGFLLAFNNLFSVIPTYRTP